MGLLRTRPAGPQAIPASANPERLLHKRFAIRPRTAGLWLRMTLTDGEELEGLAANDRSLVDGAGLLAHPARYPLQHAENLCPSPGDSNSGGSKPDRKNGPQDTCLPPYPARSNQNYSPANRM